jgi:siroheme synthase (precorrin-2 oxidase/ferrochelatase)
MGIFGISSEKDSAVKVYVIGCGPAGLAAAHAAVGLDARVTVYAPKAKTPQRGPLLIQRPIPGINTDHPDGTIHQRVIGGSILDYRYKLYGDINIGINGDMLRPEYHAWKHPETYDKLWDLYEHLIVPRKVSQYELFQMQDDADLVVSTANSNRLCRRAFPNGLHNFEFVQVAITPKAEYPDQPDNTIIFNAGSKHSWVRSSKVFGQEVTEWSVNDFPDGPDARVIKKPISTDCNCYPRVLRTGRFGAWKNEVWIDTAYYDTYGAIVSAARRDELNGIT